SAGRPQRIPGEACTGFPEIPEISIKVLGVPLAKASGRAIRCKASAAKAGLQAFHFYRSREKASLSDRSRDLEIKPGQQGICVWPYKCSKLELHCSCSFLCLIRLLICVWPYTCSVCNGGVFRVRDRSGTPQRSEEYSG